MSYEHSSFNIFPVSIQYRISGYSLTGDTCGDVQVCRCAGVQAPIGIRNAEVALPEQSIYTVHR